MKKNAILPIVILIAIAILGAFHCKQKGRCEVVYKENPSTKKLEVSCNDENCSTTCYLKFRKKNSDDDFKEVPGSHTYDTTKWEYRCICGKN